MLKGIDPRLSAELLYLVARMGHGDDLALVDANHPAETVASHTTSRTLIGCRAWAWMRCSKRC